MYSAQVNRHTYTPLESKRASNTTLYPQYFRFYNYDRYHQSLGNLTPAGMTASRMINALPGESAERIGYVR